MPFSLSQDFEKDIDQIDPFAEEKFCFSRFADWERSLICGWEIQGADGWKSGPDQKIGRALHAALRCDLPGWYVGIACPCCDLEGHEVLKANLRVPEDHRSFSNLFVNGNYDRFMEKMAEQHWLDRCCVVASTPNANIPVASNLVNDDSDWLNPIVARMYCSDRPILLCAGPASNVLAHHYWKTVPEPMRQTVIDLGSALDPIFFGRATHGYHRPDHPNRQKICTWSLPAVV